MFENWNIRFESNKKVRRRRIVSDDCLFWNHWHYTQSLNLSDIVNAGVLSSWRFATEVPACFFFKFLNRYCCQSTHYSFVTYYDNSTIVSARIAYSSYMGALERIKCSSFNLKVKKSQCFISPFNSNFRIKIVNMTLPIELQFLSFLVLGRNSINKQI